MKYINLKSAIIVSVILSFSYYFYSCQSTMAGTVDTDKLDYNYHIRPILSDRCFACHGPDANKREANLRLDTEEDAFAVLKDNPGKHAIVKFKPEQSEIVKRIFSEDLDIQMPPPTSNLTLTEDERKMIEKWIKQGAKYKKHWSFIAPVKTKLPDADQDWVKNPIDNFTYAKMKEKGLKPSEEAPKETLLKRLSLDLTGLVPSLEMQDAFIADNSEYAYEKVANKLLKSKQYGEKMAQNWLDVARYADSHGYQDDGLRTMWPWRDWVIHAFNSNYSYKKFVSWQLAGDIIAKQSPTFVKNKEMVLATGFNRNHKITQEGGVIDEEYRVEYVSDRTNTFGKAFMALTFECAKCHDHKYDPIAQKDYYGTFSFFNKVPEKGIFGLIDDSWADPPNLKIKNEDIKNIFNFINKKDTLDLFTMVMQDSVGIRPTFILQRGVYDAHGDTVDYGLPKAIKPFTGYAKNRYGLTQWMFADDNPLTARVYVNRIWEQFFGRGLVKTVGDFGMQGDLPSNPELLDWLAKDFQDNGWNIKRLVGQIVSSATYRQSSSMSKELLETDPENIYLARMSRLRLPAENVRDHILFSSDLLNTEVGGPSTKPYQPKGLWEVATSGRGSLATYIQDKGEKLYRRGMYVFIKRTVPPPSMLIFDSSNRDQCEVTRGKTNTPLQALAMLNDPHILESANHLAYNAIINKKTGNDYLLRCFRKIICRTPSKKEIAILENYNTLKIKEFTKNPAAAKALFKQGEFTRKDLKNYNEFGALMETILLIYNMEEAIIRI